MQIAINTSQNININFTIAEVGERTLAYFIDLVIKIAYLIFIFFIIDGIFDFNSLTLRWDPWSVGAFYIIIYLPVIFYRLVMESLAEGQTVGKMILKIKVVKIDGYQASFGDYLMRWFFTIIDISFSFGFVGLLTMILNKNNQRLGDIAAGTTVISLKNRVNISHTILEELSEEYQPTFAKVISLSDNDMRIIKENYQRYDPEITSKLTKKIKELLKIEVLPQDMTERKFIDTIIKDYNYYTGQDL